MFPGVKTRSQKQASYSQCLAGLPYVPAGVGKAKISWFQGLGDTGHLCPFADAGVALPPGPGQPLGLTETASL